MILTELEMIFVTYLPSIAAVISTITAALSIIKSLNQLKDNSLIKAERDALLDANKQLVSDMMTIKKQTALLIEKASNIVYNDMSEVKNDKDLQI